MPGGRYIVASLVCGQRQRPESPSDALVEYHLPAPNPLEDALEDAWRRVELSKAPWASEDYSTAGRTILAQHIITMAKGGERDAKWLADSAILYLSQQKLTRTPPETV